MLTTRRNFMLRGLCVSAAVPLTGPLAGALAGDLAGDLRGNDRGQARALVVVQLSGGNDGLNTVVPHRQDAYFRGRPTLGLKRGSLHPLDDEHGLHPQAAGLGRLFERGLLTVHHGVGLPAPERSHFRAMELWHTAAAGEHGWLGRMTDQLALAAPGTLPALHIGDGRLPLSLRGSHSLAPTIRGQGGLRLAEEASTVAEARSRLLELGGGGAELAFLRDAARSTYAAAERMEAAVDRSRPGDYPSSPFAQRLRLIASLIAGDFGARLFQVELTGFDTHARQAPLHAALIEQLSQALAAFQADLASSGAAERVTTLVFSEFGRRAAENGSKGTDHGAGAPLFLLGHAPRPGLIGTPPDLDRLVDGDVPASTDFRSVYAALERDWMGLEPSSTAPPARLF